MMWHPKKRSGFTFGDTGGWNTDLGILKDPPKTVMSKRRDKVFDDNRITNAMLEGTKIAVSEAISTVKRYDNSNLGLSTGNIPNGKGFNNYDQSLQNVKIFQQQVKYPHKVMEKSGYFHPPVHVLLDLAPLSRMPRPYFSYEVTPELPGGETANQLIGSADLARGVKSEYTKVNVTAAKTANNVVSNTVHVFNAKDSIKEHVYSSIVSGPTARFDSAPIGEADIRAVDKTWTSMEALRTASLGLPDRPELRELTRNVPLYNMSATKSDRANYTSIRPENEIILDRNVPLYSMEAAKNDRANYTFITPENEIILDRNLPMISVTSNKTDRSIYVNNLSRNVQDMDRNVPEYQMEAISTMKHGDMDQYGTRTYKLREKVNPNTCKHTKGGIHLKGNVDGVLPSRENFIPIKLKS
jgi:hypothetical protein